MPVDPRDDIKVGLMWLAFGVGLLAFLSTMTRGL